MKLKDELEALEKAAVAVRKYNDPGARGVAIKAELEKMQWIIDANERDSQKKSPG